MSKFLRALQKAGLVQLDEAAGDVQVPPDASADAVALPPEPAPVAEPPRLGAAESQIVEQRPFDALYAERAVPPSPFPAEKLLKLLDGLKAMDPATRKAAVLAMDAADDAWTLDDALLDATRKIKALTETRSHLAQQASSAAAHAQELLKEREQRLTEASTAIRQQIADLEALLQREVEKAAGEKAALEASAQSAREACSRETLRLDTEAARLQAILGTFGSGGTVPGA